MLHFKNICESLNETHFLVELSLLLPGPAFSFFTTSASFQWSTLSSTLFGPLTPHICILALRGHGSVSLALRQNCIGDTSRPAVPSASICKWRPPREDMNLHCMLLWGIVGFKYKVYITDFCEWTPIRIITMKAVLEFGLKDKGVNHTSHYNFIK